MADDYKLFINGEFVDAAVGRDLRHLRPGHRREARRRAQGRQGGRDQGHRGRPQGLRRGPVAEDERQGARRQAAPDRRAHRRQRRRARRDRGPRRRRHDPQGACSPTCPARQRVRVVRPHGRGAARRGRARRARRSRASENYVRYEPIGVCTGIIPWNFPLIMAAWKIAPAIAAGNSLGAQAGVVHVAHRARSWRRSSHEADLPPGVVNVIAGPGGTVGEELRQQPARRQDRVHRLDRGRPPHHAARVGHREAGDARAGRQVGQHRARRRRPRHRRRRRAVGHVLPQRPGVRVGHPGARAARHLRRVRRPARRPRRQDRHRRPARLGAPTSARSCRTARSRRSSATWQLGRDEVGEPIVRRLASPTASPTASTPTRSTSRRSSPTSTTRRRSPRRRSSARCCASSPSTPTTRPSPSPTTRSTASAAACSAATSSGPRTSPAGMRTGTVWINDYHLITPERPFGGYKQSGIGRELGTAGLRRLPPGQARPRQPRDRRPRQPLPLRDVGRVTALTLRRLGVAARSLKSGVGSPARCPPLVPRFANSAR